MKLIYYFISAFVICMVICCKNDDKSQEMAKGSYRLPQAIKDYNYFLEGTYWIYKDSVSGAEDSVYVYNAVNVFDTLEPGNQYGLPPAIYEAIETDMHSTYDEYNYYNIINTTYCIQCVDGNLQRPCYYVERTKTQPGDYVGYTYSFFYKFQLHYSGYAHLDNDGSRVELVATDLSLAIDTFFFDKVQKFYTNKNRIENDNNTNYYISPHFGIVRKELLDSNQVWNLVRCHIIQ